MVKNITFKVSALIISFALITPLFVSAQTVTASADVTSQVKSLLSQISVLEEQLHALVSSVVGTTTMSMQNASSTPPRMPITGGALRCVPLNRDLSIGSRGDDVAELQQMLADQGFLSASSTGFFGALTAQAVARFQDRFAISASSTGAVGPLTRSYILSNLCGQNVNSGDGHSNMGSTTPPTLQMNVPPPAWHEGSTTPPMPCGMPAMPASNNSAAGSAHTNIMIMRPCGGDIRLEFGTTTAGARDWRGGIIATTTPLRPCIQPANQNNDQDQSNLNSAAAAIAALFVPHAITPGMMHPCPPTSDVSGEMEQQ